MLLQGGGRPVNAKVNTGFVRPNEVSQEHKALTGNDEVADMDAASAATGGGKPVKAPVNTGFKTVIRPFG